MARDKTPTTQAIRVLKAEKVDFKLHQYKYEEKGGTSVAARELDVDEHRVVKTLVFEDENKQPVMVLMHGDKQVSLKNLARELSVKTIAACTPDTANKHTGYMVGGISPFGTKRKMPVYYESSIEALDEIFINAGKRGLLTRIKPGDVIRILKAHPVNAAI